MFKVKLLISFFSRNIEEFHHYYSSFYDLNRRLFNSSIELEESNSNKEEE
jgi:hypothetical protein